MPAAARIREIDELMEQASTALSHTAYFQAERQAQDALGMARQAGDFERMSRIILPLQEARRQRAQQAFDVGRVSIVSDPVTEEMHVQAGCFIVQPPHVGADARRLRLLALDREIPLAVLCREPRTQIGQCPIVAISPGLTVRTRIDPPEDWDQPDFQWFVAALEQLGDFAIDSLDSGLTPIKRVDALLMRLDVLPEHEGLHHALDEACRRAHRTHLDEQPPRHPR